MKNRKNDILSLFLILATALLIIASNSAADIRVIPTTVIMSENSRTESVTLYNDSESPNEVSILIGDFLPGHIIAGDFMPDLEDSLYNQNAHFINGWLRIFPNSATLAPGLSQPIRFIASPPGDLPDGEYWAVIIVDAAGGGVGKDLKDGKAVISRHHIIVKYRKGDLAAKIEVNKIKAKKSDSVVTMVMDLVNKGNCSYVGTLDCQLLDSGNAPISKKEVDLEIFEKVNWEIELPIIPGIFILPYHIALEIDSKNRRDNSADKLIAGNRIKKTVPITTE